MRIGVFGAGAIGCVVGGLLTKAGHDVTLVDQWPEHIETMKRRGLKLSGTCGDHTIPVKALHIHELQGVSTPFEAIFVAVKSYDTEWAAQMALTYLATPGGVVVDFQNGINDERVASVVGKDRCLGCVITIGAGMYEPGHAMRTDSGSVGFKIGEHDGRDTPRAQALAKVMNDVAGTKVTTNLWGERWSKLAVNCMVNPISGLSGYDSAEARTAEVPRRIAVFTAAEVIQVGRARGYEVEPIYSITAQRFVDATQGTGLAEVEAEMARDAKSRVGGRPSMLQDVMKGRRTEINYLNGYVSDQGKQVGVKTPINDKIVELVNAPGVGLLKPDRKNLEPLWALVPH
jgi:2-dehydropantoate 2-reductase